MATLQARIMLVMFVGLAAAITYNAIFLQTGRHPASLSVEEEGSAMRAARKVRQRDLATNAQSSSGKSASMPPRSQTILAIQRKLTEDGYEPGPVDGVFGHMTRAAIMAYQHDQGLAVTGEGASRLLKVMIFGTSVGASDPDAGSSVPEETKELVRGVQKTLTKLGYKPGPADGVWGAATRKAIERFERKRGMEVKGRISGRLLRELTRAAGTSLALVISG